MHIQTNFFLYLFSHSDLQVTPAQQYLTSSAYVHIQTMTTAVIPMVIVCTVCGYGYGGGAKYV